MSNNGNRLLHGAKHRISSPFGYRIHPITGKPQGHNGVDYATYGAKIPCYAPAEGEVLRTGKDKYGALFVYVGFPELGRVGLYYHLDKISVRTGERVGCDTQIGIVGTTGRSTGVHLHFSWIVRNAQALRYYEADYEDFEKYAFPAEPEEGEEEMAKRYGRIEELPKALQKEARELVTSGALAGNGGTLDVTEDMIRTMIVCKRYADQAVKEGK